MNRRRSKQLQKFAVSVAKQAQDELGLVYGTVTEEYDCSAFVLSRFIRNALGDFTVKIPRSKTFKHIGASRLYRLLKKGHPLSYAVKRGLGLTNEQITQAFPKGL